MTGISERRRRERDDAESVARKRRENTCEVCGTDRTGMNNDEVHRRRLSLPAPNSRSSTKLSVTYCADVVECGEAAAMDYLQEIACDNCHGTGNADPGHYVPGTCAVCGGSGRKPEELDENIFTDAHPIQRIAEEGGPEAAGMVAALMEQSAAERESIEASLNQALVRERDEWKERALAAEERIGRIEANVRRILW